MKKQLIALIALCTLSLHATTKTEHEISDAQLQETLAELSKPHPEETAVPAPANLDLNKVNSSNEKPYLSFSALEESLHKVEQEVANLKAHLADIKEAAIKHGHEARERQQQLKDELQRAQQAAESAATANVPLEANGDDMTDDETIEAEGENVEQQDVVAIIANEGDAEEEDVDEE